MDHDEPWTEETSTERKRKHVKFPAAKEELAHVFFKKDDIKSLWDFNFIG